MTPLYLTLGYIVVAVLAFLGGRWTGKRDGRNQAVKEAAENAVEMARKGRRIDEDVARMSDAALDDELRSPR